MALGAQTACVRARIDALIVAARPIVRTLHVHNALRPTGGRRTAVAAQTRTDRLLVVLATLAVRSARRRLARESLLWRIESRCFATLEERIAYEAFGAHASRHMLVDVTDGVRAADADARIDALVLHARQFGGAVIVRFALASTAARHFEGIAFVAGQTEAGSGTVGFAAFGVRAARRRLAGLRFGWGCAVEWTNVLLATHV